MGAGRDERASVRAAQRGSASGIEALFRLHWPRAYRAAYLVVHDAAAAEDISQEAFLAAVRNLDRFDRGRRPSTDSTAAHLPEVPRHVPTMKHASWDERATRSSRSAAPRGLNVQSVPRASDGVKIQRQPC